MSFSEIKSTVILQWDCEFVFPDSLRYGAKIRAPHALVMTFLFRSGRWEWKFSFIFFEHRPLAAPFTVHLPHSLKDKLGAIVRATYTHSRNLACFVLTYKGLQAVQRSVQGKSLQSHSFLAACVGGWLVFGDNNNINSQVWFIWNPLVPCCLGLNFISRCLPNSLQFGTLRLDFRCCEKYKEIKIYVFCA